MVHGSSHLCFKHVTDTTQGILRSLKRNLVIPKIQTDMITADYPPGYLNIILDWESRIFQGKIE